MQEGVGPRPYDVTSRQLIAEYPEGWLRWIGLPPDGPVQPVDSDLGTVLAEVDKVLRVDGPRPWLAHLELQASHDPQLPSRLLQYNALLHHRHRLVVESTIVLLRRDADGPELTGLFELHGRNGFQTVAFGYHVVRLWDQPIESLMNGSLGVLPLAPLADAAAPRLPAVLRHVEERLRQEAPPSLADELWAATFLLLGLRYDDRTVSEVKTRMSWLQESSTYRAILAEGQARGEALGEARGVAVGEARGRVDEARRLLLALGSEKFGAPDEHTTRTVTSLDDLAQLERLLRRVLTATTWSALLSE